MKYNHKVTFGGNFSQQPDAISDRYQEEIDASLRKAEKAWKSAERRHRRVEKQAEKDPTPSNAKLLKLVLEEVERLRQEFLDIERLMKSPPVSGKHRGKDQKIFHRTGLDNRLESGYDHRDYDDIDFV